MVLALFRKLTKYVHSGGRVALAIHRCQKPTIAAMQGSAVGVGMTMTLPAAIRYLALKRKINFYHNETPLRFCPGRWKLRVKLQQMSVQWHL